MPQDHQDAPDNLLVAGRLYQDGADEPRKAGLVLQGLLLDRPLAVRPLYWTLRQADRAVEADTEEGLLQVPPGAVLGFDTYFNAFYEQNWRLHTGLGALSLRLDLRGACTLRVRRRTAMGERLVIERRLDGAGPVLVPIPRETLNFRQHGMVVFEIEALEPMRVLGGAWVTEAASARPVGLAPVFCTFNRETDIAAVLLSITGDAAVLSRLARIHVVNQGRPGLAAHPAIAPILARHADKLRIIEQANFGGAGGFGRGLLAAIDDPAATHAVLLDDDIRIEPDSLLRMASFFALATEDFPVGGQMLDMVQPTQVYEGGALLRPENWSFNPQHHRLDAGRPEKLTEMLAPQAIHYNGWWCLGVPLTLVEREGMPLPCFIRGDDLEFGMRLYFRGIHTVTMPGIAVWHEPFYLKMGGWQLYYETRNMLVAAALHFGVDGRGMASRMMHHFFFHMLTFRYYSSALILQAIVDFLRGPEILEGDPLPLHAGLASIRERYPAEAVARGVALPEQPTRPEPKGPRRGLIALARNVLENAIRPTVPHAAPHRLPHESFVWTRLGRADCLAIETFWDRKLPVFRRSREVFRALLRDAIPALLRLRRDGSAVSQRWRDAFPRHSSTAFWRDYLGLVPDGDAGAPVTPAAVAPGDRATAPGP
ncbi:glycosyltransferase [Roseomonas sp. WA12]